ncbi:hypothetical protein ACFQZZ_33105 [Nocardia sp. GCM10030253]|uniref:hypothetical protein n=1 Tax=Nocardia sp. GCM10030253 TaxID=3273404 RepID=UPI0036350566
MPTWLSLLLAGLAGMGVIGLLAAVMLLAARSPDDQGRSSVATPAPGNHPTFPAASSLAQSAAPNGEVSQSIWPTSWTHNAPGQPFTVADAHREMQVHRNCRLDGCARKAAAFSVLVEAGRVTPDSSRQQY